MEKIPLRGALLSAISKYNSGHQIKKNAISRACDAYGREERCTQGFGGRPEQNRPLGISRSRWEDNMTLDIQDLGLN